MILAGKKFLITGSTGGIGAELCRQLNEEGVTLLLSSHTGSNLERLNASLGSQHSWVSADLTTTEGRQQIVTACKQLGGVDGVINMAGTLDFDLFAEQSSATVEKLVTTNFLAPVLLTHELLPMLASKPEAVLLNVGSIFGSIGHPGFVAYCASKAGIKSFTEALSRELADTAIRVCYIAPRATSTTMNSSRVNAMNEELGNKSDSPQFVAEEIIKQLSGTQRVKYLGWPEKLFVRVNAVLPGLVHKAMVKNLPIMKKFATEGKSL